MGRYSRLPIGGGVTIQGGGTGVGGAANLANAGRIVKVSASGIVTQSAGWTDSSGHLLAVTDNTYDIGASGATRPRHIYVAGNAVVAGNVTATGTVTGSNIATPGLVFISQFTASGAASLDCTSLFSASYNEYLIILENVTLASDNVSLTVRMGAGSYDSGANYRYAGFYNGIGDTVTGLGAAAQTSGLMANSVKTTANWGIDAQIHINNVNTTGFFKKIRATTQTSSGGSSTLYLWDITSIWLNTAAADRIQFLASSGNISGTGRLYGYKLP